MTADPKSHLQKEEEGENVRLKNDHERHTLSASLLNVSGISTRVICPPSCTDANMTIGSIVFFRRYDPKVACSSFDNASSPCSAASVYL